MEHLRHLSYESAEGIARITLRRGKVNAINADVVFELRTALDRAEVDDSTRAVILTGEGSFFSFGFDIPELRPYSPEEFTRFLIDFSDLYTRMYLYAKPIVAALNGHAIAGGCMLGLVDQIVASERLRQAAAESAREIEIRS